MSQQTLSTPARPRLCGVRVVLISLFITLLIIYLALGPALIHRIAEAPWRPHAPRLELIGQAHWAVQLHLFTIVPAFVIGTILVLGPKGRLMHRTLGWTFTVLMVLTAVAALFIPNPGGVRFSLLYLFSLFTLITLPLAVRAARRHDVARHSRSMLSLYLGGLVLAGALAFIPGRLLWQVIAG